jgi:signal transduction histidine kinase
VVERSTKNIELERERLLTLINNMQDAVLACDSSFRVVLYNAATLSLLDTHDELFGKPIGDYLELRDSKNQPVILPDIVGQDGRMVSSNDFELVYNENERINLYIGVSHIKLAGENAGSGYMIILRDITKQKNLDDERDEFIAVMSHELRTPVSIVEGSIALARMAEKGENNSAREYLDKAHEQIEMLAEIVNSLSTLVTIQSDRDKPHVSEIQPTEVLNALRTSYETEAKAKNLELIVRQGEHLPAARANKEYLDEVLQNFITNALKYTKQGSIIIEAKQAENGALKFCVSDTGIGISKSDQNHVFDKFWRSEDFHTRESGGTGLGLYIANKLAEIMHARLDVSSELGHGTTFSITLPQRD